MSVRTRIQDIKTQTLVRNIFIILAGIVICIVAGWNMAQWNPLNTAGALGLVALLLVSTWFCPELPLVIFVAGMFIWTLFPAGLFAGLAVPLTLILCIICIWLRRVWEGNLPVIFRLTPADVWLFVFTIWITLGSWWSSAPGYGQLKFLGFAAYTVGGYAITRWGYHPAFFDVRRMAKVIVVAGVCHALVAVHAAQVTGLWRPDIGETERIFVLRGWGLNAISESDALVLGLLGTTALFIISRPRGRWLLGLVYLLQLWALLTYQQRGAALSLLFATIVLVALLSQRVSSAIRNRAGLSWFVAGVVALVLSYSLINWNPQFEIEYMTQDPSVLVRMELYRTGWEMFAANPVIGEGTGSTPGFIGAQTEYARVYVHNRILEVMAENGLVGLFLLVAFTVAVIRSFFRTVRYDPSAATLFAVMLAMAGLISRYTVGMFSGDLTTWNIGVWAGLIVAIHEANKQIVPPPAEK